MTPNSPAGNAIILLGGITTQAHATRSDALSVRAIYLRRKDRSAPMANEDVLDLAEKWKTLPALTDAEVQWCLTFANAAIIKLAAALREARKDRERLKALAKYVRDGGSVHGEDMASNLTDLEDASDLAAIWYGRPSDFYEDRIECVTIEALADAIIDAAMKPPGGEG